MTKFLKSLVLAAGLVGLAGAAVPNVAHAVPVYDTAINMQLTGARSTAVEIIIAGGDVTSATLAWEITQNGSLWHYKYTLTEDSDQSISHFILDLSDNCDANSRCVTEVGWDLEFGTFTTSGNPGFNGSITGVKFDNLTGDSPWVLEFDSTRAPVWGDVYLKGGNGDSNGFALYNAGAIPTTHPSENIFDFVARPDTTTTLVPEPNSLLLIGGGLLALALLRRRRG